MAPELGLFLDECYFESYSQQWEQLHAPLRQSDYAAEVLAFKVCAAGGGGVGRFVGGGGGHEWGVGRGRGTGET